MRPPVKEPWGLVEMWIADPDGTRIVLVEVPAEHPLRYLPEIPQPPPGHRDRRARRMAAAPARP
ncbi:hypothetical protein STENM36S_08115 [Streptomyces tendae]